MPVMEDGKENNAISFRRRNVTVTVAIRVIAYLLADGSYSHRQSLKEIREPISPAYSVFYGGV
jgi:hypothetical protein